MINRYETDEMQLDPGERVGWQFVTCAQEIHTELMRLHDGKRMAAQLKMIDDAGNELGKLLGEYESIRSVFKVPQQLRDDYSSAYRRYQNIKKNPDFFYAEEQIKRQKLEKEQKMLADKIPQKEVALAREEDERRYEAAAERKRLTRQAEALRNQIAKYRQRSELPKAKFFSGCVKKNGQKLERAQAELEQVEQALESIGNKKNPDMDDLQYQLDLLRERRWEVEKEIHVYDDNPEQRIKRWEAAVDDAQVQMYIRQIETDHVIDRFYGRFSQQLMHAFLKVYAMLYDCLAELEKSDYDTAAKISVLTKAAGKIYCPELTNRSIVTLYKNQHSIVPLIEKGSDYGKPHFRYG